MSRNRVSPRCPAGLAGRSRRALGISVSLALLAGCGDLLGSGGKDGAFRFESSDPPAGASGVSALEPVILSFSRNVDPASVAEGVSLQVEGRPLMVEYTLLGGDKVRLNPTDPLDFGTGHEVLLTGALRSVAGDPLSERASVAFTTEGRTLPAVSADSLLRHLEALAHDSMRGRGSGSGDELRAAEYLRERFVAYGLHSPAGGMIQDFSATSRRGDTLLFSRNVLAVLPGRGSLAEEWVVVGAHYDHIGFRDLADESQGPNNGADDNASGTAMVLEMARLFRAWVEAGGSALKPRRSILFAGWGAEEEGLLGSCHYVFEEPAVPLAHTRALLNFDMVGRLRDDVLVVSGGETSQVWYPMVQNANVSGLTLYRPTSSSPSGTDHACFWMAAIPWQGFFTRTHAEYHRPGDDTELINVPGMVRIGELALRVLARVVVMPEAPAFQGQAPG